MDQTISGSRRFLDFDVLLDNKIKVLTKRSFIAPGIPEKKLKGALKSYGIGVSGNEVALLVDDTRIGRGTDGLLLTHEHLIFKESFGPRTAVALDDIDRLNVEDEKVTLDGDPIMKPAKVNPRELADILTILKQSACLSCEEAAKSKLPVAEENASEIEQQQTDTQEDALEEEGQEQDQGLRQRVMDSASGVIAENKDKVLPLVMEKGGSLSYAALQDEETIEKLAAQIYTLLPTVVRIAIREATFIKFVHSNRVKLLETFFPEELAGVEEEKDIAELSDKPTNSE